MERLISVTTHMEGKECSYRICLKASRSAFHVGQKSYCSAQCAALAIVYAETGITHELIEAFGT